MRTSGWDQALGDYLQRQESCTFSWGKAADGQRDCCTFAAGAVEAMTGADPMAEFRDKYSTKIGAARALRRYGAGTLEQTMDVKFSERPICFARRGDLAFIQNSNDAIGCVGVVIGANALFVGSIEVSSDFWNHPDRWKDIEEPNLRQPDGQAFGDGGRSTVTTGLVAHSRSDWTKCWAVD